MLVGLVPYQYAQEMCVNIYIYFLFGGEVVEDISASLLKEYLLGLGHCDWR